MTRPLVTVPIPTVPGREAYLARAIAAYEAQGDVEIIVFRPSPTCGHAWHHGAQAARGRYIHFGADDVELAPGAFAHAIATIQRNQHPAPLVLNPDGTVQSCGGSWQALEPDGAETSFSRGPFIATDWWPAVGPIPSDLHYWTDNLVSDRLRQRLGIPSVVCHGYRYVHHLAQPGRGAGMTEGDRMARDRALYETLIREAA